MRCSVSGGDQTFMDGSKLLERGLGSENRLEGSLGWLHLNAGITVCPGTKAGMQLAGEVTSKMMFFYVLLSWAGCH